MDTRNKNHTVRNTNGNHVWHWCSSTINVIYAIIRNVLPVQKCVLKKHIVFGSGKGCG